MRFTLTIELGNDAMQRPSDIARALQSGARQLQDIDPDDNPITMDEWEWGAWKRVIRDVNGNNVGEWKVQP